MPVPSPVVWSRLASRLVIALCALTLLATAVAASPDPVAANGLSDAISSSRRGQSYAESLMLQADAQVAAIKAQARASRRALLHAKRAAIRGHAALAAAKSDVLRRRARLAEAESSLADPPEDAQLWLLEKRVRAFGRDLRSAQRRKASIGRQLRASIRARKARQHRLGSLRRQIRPAVSRREYAEAVLGAYMTRMTDLARARVEHQTDVGLAAGSSFSWPAVGRISQTYGCTGFYLNPRRGSCRHFHDGLDIVATYGSGVRAAAVGVVAYAGWNPYDEGGRAWIVVIVHPSGYVSRYGHMIAGDRVRAGELVHTGQLVGRMGNTGRSTGTHLHFELLRGGTDVNPWAYLPSGVTKIRIDRSTTRKGKGKKAAARQERKAAARKARKAERRERAEAREQGDDPYLTTFEVGIDAADPMLSAAACEDAAPDDAAPEDEGYATVTTTTTGASARAAIYAFAMRDDGIEVDHAACPTDDEADRPTGADRPAAGGGPAPGGGWGGSDPPDDPGFRGVSRPRRGASPVPS